ncbi:hypothetical protein [Streptomyces sp. NPDC090022]|uniref:hypothetical protein n=1 Tax=Streptomyces sp. NPDC090022 TaxID=3365920 RepID=UPI0038149924
MSAVAYCLHCDQPVPAVAATRITIHSASAARPDAHAHPDCHPGNHRASAHRRAARHKGSENE